MVAVAACVRWCCFCLAVARCSGSLRAAAAASTRPRHFFLKSFGGRILAYFLPADFASASIPIRPPHQTKPIRLPPGISSYSPIDTGLRTSPTRGAMPPSIFSTHGTAPFPDGCVGTLPPGCERPSSSTVASASIDAKELEIIRHALPTSTEAERHRFLVARNGNTTLAIEKLKYYLEWRNRHCGEKNSDFNSSTDGAWTYATQRARFGRDWEPGSNCTMIELPCTLFMLEHEQSTPANNESVHHASNKRYYLQHLPARIDTTLASTSIYALSLAIYLDRILDHRTTDQITLVIDVRSGHGWANIKAIHLLPFIQSTVKLLSDLHPLRLERCVIFPVPKVANMIWKAVAPFMGKETVNKVCFVSGPAGSNDGVPMKLSEHLDDELIRKLEETRLSCLSK
ncbi:hypothetical protein ACHAXH_009361 [Discostella pseudostelligera]